MKKSRIVSMLLSCFALFSTVGCKPPEDLQEEFVDDGQPYEIVYYNVSSGMVKSPKSIPVKPLSCAYFKNSIKFVIRVKYKAIGIILSQYNIARKASFQ